MDRRAAVRAAVPAGVVLFCDAQRRLDDRAGDAPSSETDQSFRWSLWFSRAFCTPTARAPARRGAPHPLGARTECIDSLAGAARRPSRRGRRRRDDQDRARGRSGAQQPRCATVAVNPPVSPSRSRTREDNDIDTSSHGAASRSRRPRTCGSTPSTSTPGSVWATPSGVPPAPQEAEGCAPTAPAWGRVKTRLDALGEPFSVSA